MAESTLSLSAEQIEHWRKICLSHWATAPGTDGAYLSAGESTRQANALIDMALSALTLRANLAAETERRMHAEEALVKASAELAAAELALSDLHTTHYETMRAHTIINQQSNAELSAYRAPKNEFYWCIEIGSPAEYYGVRANSSFPEWSIDHQLAWHFSTKEQAELMKACLLRSRNYGLHDLRVCDHVNILYELPPARRSEDISTEDHGALLKYLDSISWWPDTPEPAFESTDDMATQAATAIRTLAAQVRERDERIAALELNDARYRWLRHQHWTDGKLVVVKMPCLKIGSDCPSLERLDAAIDAALTQPTLGEEA